MVFQRPLTTAEILVVEKLGTKPELSALPLMSRIWALQIYSHIIVSHGL